MLIIALALFLPTYWLGRLLIVRYRLHILAWVNKISLVRVIKASRFYQLYLSLGGDLPGSGGRL
jgi:hypothetical protein